MLCPKGLVEVRHRAWGRDLQRKPQESAKQAAQTWRCCLVIDLLRVMHFLQFLSALSRRIGYPSGRPISPTTQKCRRRSDQRWSVQTALLPCARRLVLPCPLASLGSAHANGRVCSTLHLLPARRLGGEVDTHCWGQRRYLSHPIRR